MPIIIADSVESNDSSVKTFTLKEVMDRCQDFCGNEVTGLARERIKRWINSVIGELFQQTKQEYQLASSAIETVAEYTTGTVAVTKGSTAITFTDGILDTSHVGRKILISGDSFGYEILSRTSDSVGVLVNAYMGETKTAATFKIVQDEYSLPSDFETPKVVDNAFGNLRLTIVHHLPVNFAISDTIRLCKLTMDNKLKFYPAPDRVSYFQFEYYRSFALTENKDDYIKVPDKYISTIAFGVARNYWLSTSQDRISLSKSQQFAQLFENGKSDMVADKYKAQGPLVQFRPYAAAGIVGYTDPGFNPTALIR